MRNMRATWGEVFPDLALCFRRLIPNEARKREGKNRKQPLFRPRAKFFTRNAGRWPLFPYRMGVYCEFFATFAAVTGADGEQSLSPVLHTLASGQEHTYRKSVYGRLFLVIRNYHIQNLHQKQGRSRCCGWIIPTRQRAEGTFVPSRTLFGVYYILS